jgi:hypothetical protein
VVLQSVAKRKENICSMRNNGHPATQEMSSNGWKMFSSVSLAPILVLNADVDALTIVAWNLNLSELLHFEESVQNVLVRRVVRSPLLF